jgi:cytochrome P450
MTRVPAQAAFWCFVINEALALHTARTLVLLASHPAAQEAVRREILAAPQLDARAIDGFAYLGACLEEQLRLWTPVPLLLRRAVRPFQLRSRIAIDSEDQLLIHAGVYHRDPAVFGERAHAFEPEAQLASPRPLYVFSAGRQSCAGQFLARFLVKSALAALLARFRFEPVAPVFEPGAVPSLCDHPRIALRAVAA